MAEHDYLAHADRLRLCDLMVEVGPAAPTLCEGWSTKDLPRTSWPGIVARTACPGWSSSA